MLISVRDHFNSPLGYLKVLELSDRGKTNAVSPEGLHGPVNEILNEVRKFHYRRVQTPNQI